MPLSFGQVVYLVAIDEQITSRLLDRAGSLRSYITPGCSPLPSERLRFEAPRPEPELLASASSPAKSRKSLARSLALGRLHHCRYSTPTALACVVFGGGGRAGTSIAFTPASRRSGSGSDSARARPKLPHPRARRPVGAVLVEPAASRHRIATSRAHLIEKTATAAWC